mgnify:CR=1 FL=1
MSLRLTNTLTRRVEPFAPTGGEVKLYVCGVTPYDECHVGHAFSYVVFDVLRRYLEYRGYRVRHVQNFTDIDDKIIVRARHLGISVEELAERYIQRYHDDMKALNVLPAHVYPRATQEIPEMIRMIQGLIDKGYAYVAEPVAGSEEPDVYYRVERKPDYGKLSHRTLASMLAGARIEPGEHKESPMDFALWKGAKPGEPSWESPWGRGRPGWHIECSAMSLRYLGEELDIHGGGEDLIFPHHENEIAQTEAYTGHEPFVRFWVHNAWVKMGEEKMSKSLGNIVSIRDALAAVGADALRFWILTSHYRKPLTYTDEALKAAKGGVGRLRIAARAPVDGAGEPVDPEPFARRFTEAMDDDLNTPQALAALFDLAREINRGRDEARPVAQAQAKLLELAEVVGLRLEEEEVGIAAAPFIELLIDIRQELRKAKQFPLADLVRSRLSDLGVALEDTPEGTVWRRRD